MSKYLVSSGGLIHEAIQKVTELHTKLIKQYEIKSTVNWHYATEYC
jgi:hypothetical protein